MKIITRHVGVHEDSKKPKKALYSLIFFILLKTGVTLVMKLIYMYIEAQ